MVPSSVAISSAEMRLAFGLGGFGLGFDAAAVSVICARTVTGAIDAAAATALTITICTSVRRPVMISPPVEVHCTRA
jgi:hypothetical protein